MRKGISGLVVAAMLVSSCGGGGSSGGSTVVLPTPTPTPTPTGTSCALADRQAWVYATMQEWYLFPETLPTTVNPASHTTLTSYVDALTATARSQGRDRYFTYVTSIADENAYYASGATAGFGVRLAYNSSARRVFIMEAYEGAPALAAGIDRGDEIIAIGTSTATLRNVADIIASEGTAGVSSALGPNTAGTTRLLRVANAAGTRDVTVAKADYSLTPVSSRYGARVISANGEQIGYLNLRTFISSADQQLRDSFSTFRSAGITKFIVDLRYNGGGLISTAEVFGDMLGGNRSTSDIFSRIAFRPEKAAQNATHYFAPTSQSVSPVKIAFIGTGASASASELVMNGMAPWLGTNMALIGTNTYGKPVGQIAVDRTACDDRLRVIAFATTNSAGNANYYSGLATTLPVTCQATDDPAFPLGDAREDSVAKAINFLSGQPCTAITGIVPGAATASADRAAVGSGLADRHMLMPTEPDAAQRENPGLY
ncbi:MAG: S41 family peptidase [Sphingopyxis sp.]